MDDTARPPSPRADEAEAAALFQDEWRTYRKILENNYLFHRQAYDRLHRLLLEEAPPSFRFLDIACGDASATVEALRGTKFASYHGIDLSQDALDLARQATAELGCPVTLERKDFVTALRHRPIAADVIWIGLSLHHLILDDKLTLMRAIRRMVSPDGLFVIYENTSREGEERESWLRRWDEQRPSWSAFSELEWERTTAHVHAFDHPEWASNWHRLGRQAGFSDSRELMTTPTDLFRLFAFRP